MSVLIERLKNNIKSIPGWSTRRHIVVIESDDWGSIRMPSKETFAHCLRHGYRVDQNVFTRFDSLASEDDLENLFELLISFKDGMGNHPVISANCLVANPDFDKIRNCGFKEYHYELISDTFSKYPNHGNNLALWKEGMEKNIFRLQSHGREHLNVSRFLKDLRQNNPDAIFAFENRMPGIFRKQDVETGNDYVVSLEHLDDADKESKSSIITESLQIFRQIFGYTPICFTPANNVWHKDYEKDMYESGIRFIMGSRIQLSPKGGYRGFKSISHSTGQRNKFGQIYFVRNAHFEPSFNFNKDAVSYCMREISTAFAWRKPVIITMHRINFVGYIDIRNRDNTLFQFRELLSKIIQQYPDVEFLSSDQLGSTVLDAIEN